MIPSERSGVLFTVDPSAGGNDTMVVEAAFGQGEVVVSGRVEPDTYVVRKAGPTLLHVRVGHQHESIVRGPDGSDLTIALGEEEGRRRVLTDDEVVDLARLGLRVEEHYGTPQDIEWAMAAGSTSTSSSRAPITTLAAGRHRRTSGPASSAGRTVARGLAASPGRATGVARVLASIDDGARLRGGRGPGGLHDQSRTGCRPCAGPAPW